MPYSVKGFFEINGVMVQMLLMLEVLFTQDSEVEDLFCGVPLTDSFSATISSARGLNLFGMIFSMILLE